MHNKINKILYIFHSIWFNFHYLPFHQALKIPILFVSKPVFIKTKGKVIIKGEIKRGMILLGVHSDYAYEQAPNKFIWSNEGTCIFHGKYYAKLGSAIIIYSNAELNIGNDVAMGPLTRISCANSITIDNNVRFGMEITVMDTDLHYTYNIEKDKLSTLSSPIHIGKNCWIGIRCLILKRTVLPDYTIVGAYSICNKKMDNPPFSLIAGNPVSIKAKNIVRILNDFAPHEEMNKYREEFNKEIMN